MTIEKLKEAMQNRSEAEWLVSKSYFCKETLRKMKEQDNYRTLCSTIVDSLRWAGHKDIEEEIYKAFMESATAIFEKHEKAASEKFKEVNKEFEKI